MDLFRDHDFHPAEDSVRVFRHPPAGVFRADDDALVLAARYDDVVLWHYAFADRWFKANLTTDPEGNLVETAPADGAPAFAVNLDIATPLQLHDGEAFSVDLELDVLVRADGMTHVVTDEADLERSVRAGWISPSEEASAWSGLRSLLRLVDGGELLPYLAAAMPYRPVDVPPALPVVRLPVADVPQVQVGRRLTWAA